MTCDGRWSPCAQVCGGTLVSAVLVDKHWMITGESMQASKLLVPTATVKKVSLWMDAADHE